MSSIGGREEQSKPYCIGLSVLYLKLNFFFFSFYVRNKIAMSQGKTAFYFIFYCGTGFAELPIHGSKKWY
jgi:hypothetical protein